MHRLLHIGSLLLLAVGASLGGGRNQQKDPPQPPAKPPAKANPKVANKANNKGAKAIPKGAARAVNPGSSAVKLLRMSPEDRERAIAQLPNEQKRQEARNFLQWFDGLPKEAQEAQLRRLDRVAMLPPEKRAEVQGMVFELNHLPPPRANAVKRALYMLQTMNDRQRENTLHRPEFQARFSPEEMRLINGLADAWMGPIY